MLSKRIWDVRDLVRALEQRLEALDDRVKDQRVQIDRLTRQVASLRGEDAS